VKLAYKREGESDAGRPASYLAGMPGTGREAFRDSLGRRGVVPSPSQSKGQALVRVGLLEAYKQFFDFEEAPFSVCPNPKFFYASESHAEGLDHLRYGIYEGLGFTMITGEPGTGKTMLLRYFTQRAGEDLKIVHIQDPRMSPKELLRALLESLEVPRSPQADLTERELAEELQELLVLAQRQTKKVVVLLDEAQGLNFESLEGLRLISNLENDSEKLIHIVLFGQTELEERLRERRLRQFDQRILVRCRLRPLESGEIQPYIEHQLLVAKVDLGTAFLLQSVAKIHEISAGLPRMVNVLCERAMMSAFLQDTRRITVQHVTEGWESLNRIGILERKRL
jgi:general secretion pathway protein A